MLKKIITGLLLCIFLATPVFATGIKIESGHLTLPDGSTIYVESGFYLSDVEGKDVAEGIEILKAELAKAEADKLAYKEAYEKEKETNNKLAEIYKELYLKYEKKTEKLQEYIAVIEERMYLVEKEKIELQGEVRLYQITSILLGISLLIVGL